MTVLPQEHCARKIVEAVIRYVSTRYRVAA